MSPRAAAQVAVAERTIMFTDLVGYTEFTAARGDETALQLLTTQEHIVRETLPSGARIVKDLGDGMMICFDDAGAAVATGLLLQERLEAAAEETELPLWVRIGVHSGRPVPRGEDLIGNDVNIAARIVDLAAPGEVIASEATALLAADELEAVVFEPLGPAVVKGIPSPIPLYRALREDAA